MSYYPIGLENLNFNCYMNSLLQCLFYCSEFRKKIREQTHDSSHIMCNLLKDLMIELEKGKKYLSPWRLKNELNKNPLFKNGKEADASDLLELIFYTIINELRNEESICETVVYENNVDNKLAMYEEIKKDNDDNIINELFVGFYEKQYECQKGHIRYAFQSEYRIIFPLEKIDNDKFSNKNYYSNLNIYDCFNYIYSKQKNETERCYRDRCYQNSYLTEKIYQIPKILIIILDRGPNKKYNKTVEFYEKINLSNYIDEEQKNKHSNEYKLIGVITHFGNSGLYGHYIAICLCDDNNYYLFNDIDVKRINADLSKKENMKYIYKGSAYILFYQKIEKNNIKKNKIIGNKIYSKKNNININSFKKEVIDFEKSAINQINDIIGFQYTKYANRYEWKRKNNIVFIYFTKNKINIKFNRIYQSNIDIEKGKFITPINNNSSEWSTEWYNDQESEYNFIKKFKSYFKKYFNIID